MRSNNIARIFGVLAAVVTAFRILAATPTVTGVTAKQRYPWNGMVDITCTVSGISGTTNDLEFSVAAVNSGSIHDVSQFWVVKDGTNSTDRAVRTNGAYHLVWDSKVVWDSKADFDNQICSNMVMRVNLAELHAKVQLWEGGPYWATTNIGADDPEEYGYYFWWGDTIGYRRENDKWVASDGSSSNFSFSNNPPTHGKWVGILQYEGWITADGVLAPAHDAAQVHWGGDWRMPTKQELSDLNSKCDWTWTTQNGVQGYVVKGKGAYASASIFLPCTGSGSETSLYGAGSYGDYWSSVPDSGSGYVAWNLYFNSGYHYTDDSYRRVGQSVRAVQGFTTTVILDRQGGNGGTESVAATCGNAMPSITVPTRPGYIFGGYYAGVNGSGTQYYTASGASARDWDKTSDTTLYAKWTANTTDSHAKVQLWEGGPYWATTNIGAENPEDYGYYFWWGDTIGYKRKNDKWVASDGSSSNFCFDEGNTPTHGKDAATLQNEGRITADGVLAPAHDAAHVHWGGSWRMPTKEEISDLNSKCDWTWTTRNGVQGYVVKGQGAYASASIFLPCAGYGHGASLGNAGSSGIYLSSVPNSDGNSYGAWELCFVSSFHDTLDSYRRSYGWSVRPVQGFTN